MGIEDNNMTKNSLDNKEPMVPMSVVIDIIANLKQTFVTQEEARVIAKEELPPEFRNLASFPDTSATPLVGSVLKLGIGTVGVPATAYWAKGAGGGGLSAKGDQVLYKGVFLREYVDAVPAGPEGDPPAVPESIVAPGDEINPADYDTVANYTAALTTAGHSLKATWDWERAGNDVQTP